MLNEIATPNEKPPAASAGINALSCIPLMVSSCPATPVAGLLPGAIPEHQEADRSTSNQPLDTRPLMKFEGHVERKNMQQISIHDLTGEGVRP